MRNLFPCFILVFYFSLTFAVSADLVKLKNGDQIEGVIVRETDLSYVIEIEVTESIKDERIVAKTDVAFVRRVQDDEVAFKEIRVLEPAPEFLSANQYERRIKKLNRFIEEFPKSKRVEEVEGMLKILKEELKIVRSGGIKFGEEMVTAEDYAANAYEIEAKMMENSIREAIGKRDFLNALRQYSRYDLRMGQSAGRDSLDETILQVLQAYGANLDQTLSTLEQRTAQRAAGLERMTASDRQVTERAIAAEAAQLEMRFKKEKADNEEWTTPDAYHEGSLKAGKGPSRGTYD